MRHVAALICDGVPPVRVREVGDRGLGVVAFLVFGSGHAAAIDTSFHGPLESAATLGMLKTFQLMKPAPQNGRFLTVEHGGRNFMGLLPQLKHG